MTSIDFLARDDRATMQAYQRDDLRCGSCGRDAPIVHLELAEPVRITLITDELGYREDPQSSPDRVDETIQWVVRCPHCHAVLDTQGWTLAVDASEYGRVYHDLRRGV